MTLIAMLLLYCFGQVLFVWISSASGWSKLKSFHIKKPNALVEGRRMNGRLILGEVRFSQKNVSVYESDKNIVILTEAPLITLFFLYVYDLSIPRDRFKWIEEGKKAFIDCGNQESVYFEMQNFD